MVFTPRRSSPRPDAARRPLKGLVLLTQPLIFLSLIVVLFTTTTDAADVSGKWQASSLRVSWAIGDWGAECGPRPSGGGEKAGVVTLTQSGSDFRLSGLGRSYSTTQCWEQMPDLTARSHSAGSSTIKTTCKMPAGDPRQATVVTTWYPRGDEIYFDETGQYQFVVAKSNCTASVRRTRILTRIVDVPAEPDPAPVPAAPTPATVKPSPNAKNPSTTSPAPVTAPTPSPKPSASVPEAAPPPTPERSSQCAQVGKAVHLEVTPKSKLMRPGETFTFQATARDEAGCRVDVDAKFELIDKVGATLKSDGTLKVSSDAEAGTLRIVARVEDKSVEVGAKVVSNEEFDRLLADGDYGVLGESLEGASVTLSSSHVEFDQEDADAESSRLLYLVAGLLALVVAGGIVLFVRLPRAGRSHQSETKTELREELQERSETNRAPQANRASSKESLPVERASPTPPTAAEDAPVPPAAPARLCPICGKRYEDGTMFCVEDGARLLRAN